MNDLPLQRISELIRGVIELLWSKPEGLPARELFSRIPETIKLTNYEIEVSHSTNMPRYEEVIRLGTIPLVQAGWLVKTEKGRWTITEEGRGACRRFSSPLEFHTQALKLTEKGKQDVNNNLVYLETTQELGWEHIEEYIRGKSVVEIRRLVTVLLEAMQYHITWVAPSEKNRGLIDMIAGIDPIGAKPCRIIVQVRHKGQPATLEGLKSFHAILGQNDYGLLMSTGGFTKDAREALNRVDYQRINAMDLEKFYDIWVKHYDKLSQEAHHLLPLKAIFFLSPQASL
jgi:restriction system protein